MVFEYFSTLKTFLQCKTFRIFIQNRIYKKPHLSSHLFRLQNSCKYNLMQRRLKRCSSALTKWTQHAKFWTALKWVIKATLSDSTWCGISVSIRTIRTNKLEWTCRNMPKSKIPHFLLDDNNAMCTKFILGRPTCIPRLSDIRAYGLSGPHPGPSLVSE